MKSLYKSLKVLLLLLVSFTVPVKVIGQCSVSYTTYSYFCDLDSLILEAVPESGTAPYSFIWETGETTQQILIPLAVGDYMLTMTDATGCTHIINCHVKPYPEVLYYPFNQNACDGWVVTLFLDWFRDSIPGATYLWSTGETTSSIIITDDITWSATVTDPATGCEYVIPENFFEFHDVPDPEIIGPEEICGDQSVTLTVEGTIGGYTEWYPSYETGESIVVTGPGTYSVFTNNPDAAWCWAYDTLIITEGTIPPPIITGPPDLCDNQTGTVEITNANLYEDFLWSNGETASSWEADAPGTYTVTVTEAGGCTATGSISISNSVENDLTVIPTAATCGESNGSIDLSYSLSNSYEYLWSNGATTQDIENVPSGIYSVTVTAPDGCSSTIETTIPEITIDIVLNETITPNTSCTEFNGAIDLSVSPDGSYSYLWSTGATTQDIVGLYPGVYYVTVTTGNTCSTTDNFVVNDLSAAPEVISVIEPASCGETNGSIDVSLIGGTEPFTYEWSGGEETQDIVDIPAGTYTITVTASDGCTAIAVIDVPNENIPIILNGVITSNTSCNGANGSIDLTPSPENDYEFSWSTGSNAEDLTGLGAGTYMVTVTFGAACSEVDTFVVTSESLPFDVSGTSSPNTSCNAPNGLIDLSVSPPGSYVFSWSTGESSEDLQNLEAGNYLVTITNEDGCTITSSFTVDNLSPAIDVSGLTIANTSCQIPNGMVDISVSPSGTYTFEWSTGDTTEDLQGIPQGTYTVTVTDANGCTSEGAFIVENQSAGFTISGTPLENTSCSDPNGSIDLMVDPPGAYTFLWSNGDSSEDIGLLDAGIYEVTVTDGNSCSSVSEFAVSDNALPPVIASSITNEICSDGNASIDLTVTPSGSTFLWSNNETSEDLSNISAGTYSVLVTGLNGCTATDTLTIINTSNNFTLTGTPADNSSCNSPNGAIDLMITPAGTYTFLWSTGAITEDLQNVPEGIYSVTVVDIQNCSSTSSFTVLGATGAPIINEVITPSTCGNANGMIDLTVSPSTGNTFLWSDNQTTEDLLNTGAGIFSVIVTGSNGCSVTDTFTVIDISNNFSLSGSPTNNTSCTLANGAVDLTVTPAGSYTFLWSTGDTSEDLQNIVGGTYIVTVTDNQSCSSTSGFTVSSSTIDPVIIEVITPSTCGNLNGKIELTIEPATGNTFVWSTGDVTNEISDLSGGIYSVTVTAANGCSSTASFTVPDVNSNFSVTGTTTDNISCLVPNGSIDITTTPPGTYSFNWSNGSTSPDLNDLSDGLYVVTVTDQFNCTSTQQFIIANNTINPVVSSSIIPATCGQSNGSIDISVTLTTNYTFTWSNGQTGEDMINALPGIYQITVTSDNGCSTTLAAEIPNQNSNFTIASSISDDASCISASGTIDITISPAGSYTFMWSNGSVTEDLVNMESGIYEVTVTDNFNCSDSDMFTIEDVTTSPVVSEIVSDATCGGSNGKVDLTITPGGGNSFIWSTGDTSEDLENVPEGVYSVTVTDINGCSIESDFALEGSMPIELSLNADLGAINNGDAILCILEVNMPLPMIESITWSPAELLSCHDQMCFEQLLSIIEPTEVSVLVRDTNGCIAVANLFLDIDPEFKVYIPNVFSPNEDGPNDRFTVFANDEVEEVVELEIFDRWGNCVFIKENFPPNEPAFGWDGDFKGTPMNPAVYAYRTVVRYSNGEQHSFKGDVTLVR